MATGKGFSQACGFQQQCRYRRGQGAEGSVQRLKQLAIDRANRCSIAQLHRVVAKWRMIRSLSMPISPNH